jgi:hypothetical protein
VNLLEASTGALTITDAASVTINATGTANTASVNNTVLDATDTTSLTVTGSNKAYGLSTGAITGTTALQTLTASTSVASGTVTIGALTDATGLTTLDLTGSVSNLTFNDSADTGDAGTGEADSLATINLTATGGSTVDVGDGQTIEMDNRSDSAVVGGDLSSTVTTTVGASSTLNVGSLTNTYGVLTVNGTNSGTLSIDSLGAEDVIVTISGTGGTTIDQIDAKTGTGDDVTVTFSGGGTYAISDLDATDDVTIDASAVTASSGGVTIVLDDIAGAITVTGGAAAMAFTSADDTDGVDSQSLTLGAGNGVVDTIQLNTTDTAALTITNFATNDTMDIDIVGANAKIADTLVTLDGNGATLGTVAVDLLEISGATTLGANPTDNILVLDGNFALPSMVATALEASGTFQLTNNAAFGGMTAGTDAFLVLWDDGTDSYLGAFTGTAAAGAGTFTGGAGSVTTIVTFVGISDATDITAAMLGTTFT